MPWQTWPNPPMQTPPWQQRWRGYNQGNMPPQPYSTYPQYSQNQVNPFNPPYLNFNHLYNLFIYKTPLDLLNYLRNH